MKFNLGFFKKHKWFLLFVLLIFIIVFVFPNKYEGFTSSAIGEYEYLAPIPQGNSIPISLIQSFWNKYNEINCPDGSNNCQNGSIWINADVSNATLYSNFYNEMYYQSELEYYVQNGIFPYCGYVTNYASQNPSALGTKTLQQWQRSMANCRNFYDNVLMVTESHMNPQPLSYQIFMGTAQPPAGTTGSSTTSDSTGLLGISSSTTSSNTENNNSNYQEFVSLCQKVVGNSNSSQ